MCYRIYFHWLYIYRKKDASDDHNLADDDGFYDHLNGKPWQEIFKAKRGKLIWEGGGSERDYVAVINIFFNVTRLKIINFDLLNKSEYVIYERSCLSKKNSTVPLHQ